MTLDLDQVAKFCEVDEDDLRRYLNGARDHLAPLELTRIEVGLEQLMDLEVARPDVPVLS